MCKNQYSSRISCNWVLLQTDVAKHFSADRYEKNVLPNSIKSPNDGTFSEAPFGPKKPIWLYQNFYFAWSAPSHYMNRCWNIVNCIPGTKLSSISVHALSILTGTYAQLNRNTISSYWTLQRDLLDTVIHYSYGNNLYLIGQNKSRGFETSRDLTIRRLIGYWKGALVPLVKSLWLI